MTPLCVEHGKYLEAGDFSLPYSFSGVSFSPIMNDALKGVIQTSYEEIIALLLKYAHKYSLVGAPGHAEIKALHDALLNYIKILAKAKGDNSVFIKIMTTASEPRINEIRTKFPELYKLLAPPLLSKLDSLKESLSALQSKLTNLTTSLKGLKAKLIKS